ncbi:ATP-binding protein [Ruminococcus sp. OA3]|uniref:sensor histidine kinase n=1 Tax=Ruminococcus sp. OA3 TaxID=2914164 RepID=UPI001F070651|nr:ATP-binding protein [Ruminococcus sp. OA3]
MIRSTCIRSGEWVTISRLNITKNFRFFKSLRFRIMLILVIIGIVPSIVVENGIVSSYEDRAISLRNSNVKNQCDILSNLLISEQYFEDSESASVDGELSLFSNIYSGRILIINKDYKIIFDTYDLDKGKVIISEEVVKCFRGQDTSQYDSKNRFIEIAVPVQESRGEKEISGVMLVSVSTDEIAVSIDILEQKGMLLLLVIALLVLVFGYILSGILVKPFARVTKAIEDITDGYLDENISVPDYTETELITDAFNKMLSRVKTLDESRQEFVSNVSHELKTPLASVKVLADSLVGQENVPIEMYQEFMQDITEEIDRENKIITDLLSLVKLDKKAADLNIESININELLELILKRLKPIAAKQNIELILDSFRPVNAEVDEVKLTLALSNLVENAIKYNVDGGWVRVSLNADHKYFYVTVADSGVGIPEDNLDHIFERFYRVDKSHSREIGGTGLGLAITRSAVLMHHGAVKVYSKENEGTTFSVRIPLTYID